MTQSAYDLVYEKSAGTLSGKAGSWQVRSGIPGAYEPTPNGIYTIPSGALMAGVSGHGVPHLAKYAAAPYRFRDSKGLSWFLWIGEGDLGIHPDGNVPGTMGCIGVTNADTKPLFDKLKQLNTRDLSLQVKS